MTTEDARDLVGGLRSSPLLTGYRGSAPVDLEALAEMLSRVARLAEDLPEVVEMSLNPVVASPEVSWRSTLASVSRRRRPSRRCCAAPCGSA